MTQTREWQAGSDCSKIKELDQLPRYQNTTRSTASEADIYWFKGTETFSVVTKPNSGLTFCPLNEDRCWQLRHACRGAQVTPCISSAEPYHPLQYRPPASSQARLSKRSAALPAAAAAAASRSGSGWHGCSRSAEQAQAVSRSPLEMPSPVATNREQVASATLGYATRYSCHWEFPSPAQFSCYTGDNTESLPRLLAKYRWGGGAGIYLKEDTLFPA